MRDNFLSLNYIVEEITNREVPLEDTILNLLHPNVSRARKIFVSQLKIALKEYCRHYPLVRTTKIASSPYTFADNFDAFIEGRISENQIELIPQAVANVQSSEISKSITRNNYIYDGDSHTLKHASGLITYFTYYPIHAEESENHDFTDESGIYFIEPDTSRADMLLDQIALTLLNFLQNTRRTVAPAFQMQFFDFSDRIRELQEQVIKNYRFSSTIYNIWSKTGIK